MFLQETHLKKSPLPVFESSRFPIQIQAPGTSKARGVAILFSSRLRIVIKVQLIDPEGRFLFVSVHIEGEPFTLASIYAPNENPDIFLDNCLTSLHSFSQGPFIIGGDLNCLMDAKLDCSGPRSGKDVTKGHRSNSLLPSKILEKHQLHDIWRHQHPKERDYSFFPDRHASHSRLDYILASTSIVQNFVDSNIGLKTWSDHAWIEATLHLRNFRRQKPQWKLNSNLLFVEPLHSEFEQEIDDYLKNNSNGEVSEAMVWDALKSVLRGKFIALTAAYLKEKRKHCEELLSNIERLESVHKQSCNPKVYRKLQEEHKKLEALETTKIQR